MAKGVAVVVGGSVAGLACAHAVAEAGWEVVVLEKASAASAGGGTGAGLGLDAQSMEALARWIPGWGLDDATLPLAVDLNRATDSETKAARTLTRDEGFGFRAAHWGELHRRLHAALPAAGAVTVLWGHQFVSFEVADGGVVTATARVLRTGETVEVKGDLLVAADGCTSSIRRHFLPDLKLRYSGYCAWRGLFDFAGKESSTTMADIRRAYPELGNCLYFDLAHNTHAVLYELPNNRLNWLWYINGPEPQLTGSSVTMKASDAMVARMRDEAGRVWAPELARLVRETVQPFVNVIYDAGDTPPGRLAWAGGRVVLAGDAAHPTTPHGLRSTNMSVLDAVVLGRCLERWGELLPRAMAEYEAARLPVVTAQVLHARRLGRLKQGMEVDGEGFDARTATAEEATQLRQSGMPYFSGAPTADGGRSS